MKKHDVQIIIAGSIYKDEGEDIHELLASTFAFPLPHLLDIEVLEVETLEITDVEARQEEASQAESKASSTATTTERIK